MATKEKRKFPVPPFITSKLQQEAVRKLHFTARKTMTLAQRLYEGLEIGDEGSVGLITYMRTDSTRVAETALGAVRDHILKTFGKPLPASRAHTLQEQEGRTGCARSHPANRRGANA